MGDVGFVQLSDGGYIRGAPLSLAYYLMEDQSYYIDELIEAHSRKELIRSIQRLSYRAKSRLHKNGVGWLCLLTGPLGGKMLDIRDDHIEDDNIECSILIRRLFKDFEQNESNRVIAVHLLNSHPGRVLPEVINKWLISGADREVTKTVNDTKLRASDIFCPENIIDPTDIVKWEFFDRSKKECEFDCYQGFLNMCAILEQGAPFPLEDVTIRFITSKGKQVDIDYLTIAKSLFR